MKRAELGPLGNFKKLMVFVNELELQDSQKVSVRPDFQHRFCVPSGMTNAGDTYTWLPSAPRTPFRTLHLKFTNHNGHFFGVWFNSHSESSPVSRPYHSFASTT